MRYDNPTAAELEEIQRKRVERATKRNLLAASTDDSAEKVTSCPLYTSAVADDSSRVQFDDSPLTKNNEIFSIALKAMSDVVKLI